MPHVIVNGATQGLAGTEASWSDLLEALDRQASAAGLLVSAVRFNGVDEPGFREPAVLIRALESDAIVEVETETPGALVDRLLDEAATAVPALESAAKQLAGEFRGADPTEASRGLVQLAESLMNLIGLLAATAQATGASLDSLVLDGRSVGDRLVAIDRGLVPLVEAQAAQDWITVADVLEHDVAPHLAPLQGVIDALRPAA